LSITLSNDPHPQSGHRSEADGLPGDTLALSEYDDAIDAVGPIDRRKYYEHAHIMD
jgi:hypothetical protein